jgi:hypothetical protein
MDGGRRWSDGEVWGKSREAEGFKCEEFSRVGPGLAALVSKVPVNAVNVIVNHVLFIGYSL